MADLKETCFNYIEGDKTATFCSSERKWINIRIDDLSEDTVKYIRNSILDF